MRKKALPPQSLLHRILNYNPATGVFTWKHRPEMHYVWNNRCAGRTAGTAHSKGIVIYVDNRPFYAHRLAWVYAYGDSLDAETQIDHKNCDNQQNWIDNLRPATHGQNASNSRQRANKALPKGVSRQKNGGYRARIGIDRKVVHIGTFATSEEAHAAYVAAAVRAKGEFARAA